MSKDEKIQNLCNIEKNLEVSVSIRSYETCKSEFVSQLCSNVHIADPRGKPELEPSALLVCSSDASCASAEDGIRHCLVNFISAKDE